MNIEAAEQEGAGELIRRTPYVVPTGKLVVVGAMCAVVAVMHFLVELRVNPRRRLFSPLRELFIIMTIFFVVVALVKMTIGGGSLAGLMVDLIATVPVNFIYAIGAILAYAEILPRNFRDVERRNENFARRLYDRAVGLLPAKGSSAEPKTAID